MVDTHSTSDAKMIAAALNATRERRSSMSAVEDINRTLAELESQIAILEGETGQPLKETTQRKYSESLTGYGVCMLLPGAQRMRCRLRVRQPAL